MRCAHVQMHEKAFQPSPRCRILSPIAQITSAGASTQRTKGTPTMDHDREPGHRPERGSSERSSPATELPELVDVSQPWWRGYLQGWSDHDAGIAPRNDFVGGG